MTPERWQRLKLLFAQALERAPSERARFAEEACGGDDELRRNLLALLASNQAADTFLVEPVHADPRVATEEFLAGTAGALAVGTLLESKYRIEGAVGRGGMGEVYRATDLRLGRHVAVKMLPSVLSSDSGLLARFRQEARAVGSLNHPNVVALHDIGEHEGAPFLVTELLEGVSLRERLRDRPLPVAEAVDYASQVAKGLVAAHEKGVVHRDLKPENLFVTRDGYVKVLDFGLAKLERPLAASASTDAPTMATVKTEQGTVMGTTPYMSPEQARGLALDARTDVWSLGVVLYEMLAGRLPFAGETRSDVMVAILEREPQPLPEGVPTELRRIVSKALAKDRGERYERMREMADDLREAQRGLETGSATAGKSEAMAQTTADGEARETVSTDTPYAAPRHRGTTIVLGVAIAALVAVVAYGVVRLLEREQAPAQAPGPSALRTPKVTRLTTNGHVGVVAISPDGKFMAFVTVEEGKQTIWLRQMSSSTDAQLAPPLAAANGSYGALSFSADGESVYYGRYDGSQDSPTGAIDLYRVPILSGTPRKVLSFYSPSGYAAISRDGTRCAYIRYLPSEKASSLVVANLDGTGERVIAVRNYPEWFEDTGLSWSPDGKTIACVVGSEATSFSMTVVGVSVEDGSEGPLASRSWEGYVARVEWIADGSGLLALAKETLGVPFQVWSVTPSGEAVKVTSDVDGYSNRSLSVTADGKSIAAVLVDSEFRVSVVAPGEDSARAVEITKGRDDGGLGLCWAPNGRVFFTSTVGDTEDLWSVEADGSQRRQVTNDEYVEWWPAASPDGRYLVFASMKTGTMKLWRTDFEGNGPRQLTDGTGEEHRADISPDGRWAVFPSLKSGTWLLWKMPIDGGQAVQVSTISLTVPIVSPDGKTILCEHFDEQQKALYKWAIVSFEGGELIRTIDIPTNSTEAGWRWSSDGRSILYIARDGEVDNVWSFPLGGGKPRPITRLTSGEIKDLALSPDGKRLALSRGTRSTDAALVRDFR